MSTLFNGARARRRALLCASASALMLALSSQALAAPTVDTAQPSYDENSAPLAQNPVVFDGGTFKPSGATNPVFINPPVSIDLAGGTVDVSNADVSFSGDITGSGALHLTSSGGGAHAVALFGDDTYTGGTTVGADVFLQIGAGTTGSYNGDIVNSGAVGFGRTGATTYGGVISGSGITQEGNPAGSLILTGNNTSTGDLQEDGQGVQIGDGGSTGAWAGDISTKTGVTFDRSGAITYSGAISDFDSGHGALTQAGTGTLILTGASTFTGDTTINSGGKIQLGDGTSGHNGSLGAGAMANSGTLKLNYSGSQTFANTLSGSGGLEAVAGTTVMTAQSDSFTGKTTIDAGATLKLSGAGSIAGSGDPQVDGTFAALGSKWDQPDA